VNEYQYCVKAAGDDNLKCMQRRRDFVELCPSDWVEKWQDEIDEGKFMGIGDTLGPADEE
jgi:cytochrome c oxidase subunit 6b